MRTIIVDDEELMLKRFVRLSDGIADLNIIGQFSDSKEALAYAEHNPVELAFLDVDMPQMNGIKLAESLRKIRHDILIVFVSAYEEYIWDSNQLGIDYYLVKPFNQSTLSVVMEKIRLLAARQKKMLYVQTFGRFVVFKDGRPIKLNGKAKEILALIVTKRGKEVSNEELYSTIWEDRIYSNISMSVYYNALRRLKKILEEEGCSEILISGKHGQMANIEVFDCDYYAWQDGNVNQRDRFDGEFMSEYTWGESILTDILKEEGMI